MYRIMFVETVMTSRGPLSYGTVMHDMETVGFVFMAPGGEWIPFFPMGYHQRKFRKMCASQDCSQARWIEEAVTEWESSDLKRLVSETRSSPDKEASE